MWACASSSTSKWGPDLTLELPPHLIQEALFGAKSSEKSNAMPYNNSVVPSAPSEKLYDPLLTNEHPIDVSDPPPKVPPKPSCKLDRTRAVQVLPNNYIEVHSFTRPAFSTFKMEQPNK
nr:uncharacterized protein LOC122272174 [Parasteatoda tepidariorum]